MGPRALLTAVSLLGGLLGQVALHGDLASAVENAVQASDRHDMPAVRAALDAVLPLLEKAPPSLHEGSAALFWQLIGLARDSGHMPAERSLLDLLVGALSNRAATDAELLRARGRLAMTFVESGELREALVMLRDIEATQAAQAREPDPELCVTRVRLARVLYNYGDMAAAIAVATAAIARLEQLVPADDVDLQVAKHVLAIIQRRTDLAGTPLKLEDVRKSLQRTRRPFDRDLLWVTANLAGTWVMLQDPRGAQLQREVLQVYERDLPDDHPSLQLLRINVAGDLVETDPSAACALAEAALLGLVNQDGRSQRVRAARLITAQCRRACGRAEEALRLDDLVVQTLSERDEADPELVLAQVYRGASLIAMGKLHDACELLQRQWQICRRPPANRCAADVGAQLTQALGMMGDWPQALVIGRQVLHLRQRTCGPEDQSLVRADAAVAWAEVCCGNALSGRRALERLCDQLAARDQRESLLFVEVEEVLANTLATLGDFGGARTHQQHVLSVREASLPEDDLRVLRARANLAATMTSLEDFDGALTLQRAILAHREAMLPEGHPTLQSARGNLAWTLSCRGDHKEAVALQQRVLEVAIEHPSAVSPGLARARLGKTMLGAGDYRAAALMLQQAVAELAATGDVDRPEMLVVLAAAAQAHTAIGEFEAASDYARRGERLVLDGLARCALSPREVGMWCRSSEDAVDALGALLAAAPAPQHAELSGRWLRLVEAMRGAESLAANMARRASATGRDSEVQALTEEWRAATQRLAGQAQGADRAPAEHAVREAAAIRDRCLARMHELGSELRGFDLARVSIAELAAALPKGAVAVSLRSQAGAHSTDAEQIRAVVLSPDGTLQTLALGAMSRCAAGANSLAEQGLFSPARAELRDAVLTPLLACLPPDTKTVMLAADGALQLVPWDALELPDGRFVGQALQIRWLDSLLELLDPVTEAGAPRLLAIGGVDYGVARQPGTTQRGAVDTGEQRSLPAFGPLTRTKDELAAIAALFAAAAPAIEVSQLTGGDATASALVAAAPGAGFVHLATHGWFAPELVDGRPLRRADELLGWQLESRAPLSSRAPMTLCGLALAGANRVGNELLRRDATITAEELFALDLRRCQLVVLSICEGAVGFEGRGRGIASLRAGLRGAGARCVIASLWPVGDAATKDLMTDFYRALLAQPAEQRDVAAALWAARFAAQKREAAFQDWAGWCACGR